MNRTLRTESANLLEPGRPRPGSDGPGAEEAGRGRPVSRRECGARRIVSRIESANLLEPGRPRPGSDGLGAEEAGRGRPVSRREYGARRIVSRIEYGARRTWSRDALVPVAVAALLLALLAVPRTFAAFPLQEGFEGYADNTPLTNLYSTGWGASSNTVVIRTVTNVADVVLGTNAVVIPESMVASNSSPAGTLSNVWVELYLRNSMAMPEGFVGDEVVDTNATVELYLNTNGCPVIWDAVATNWLVVTQDYWQAAVTGFNTSAWARVTLYQDYSNKTAAVFLNEHLLLPALRFINTNRSSYAWLQLDGGTEVTSYMDEVSARYTAPTNQWSADLDNDGMLDALEFQLYGNATARHRPVITVTVPANGTVTTNGFGSGVVTNGGSFDVKPGATNTFWLAASNGYFVADARTNGASMGSFSGQFTSNAVCGWTNIVPDGLANATFELVLQPNPQVTVTPPDHGWVTPLASQVYPFQPATFTWGASNGYYAANVTTNSVPVGDFPGRYTGSGSYTWPSVPTNGGTLGVEFLRKPQLTAAALATNGPSATGGTVTLSANEVYPNGQVTCALTAEVAYAAIAVRTNGVLATTFGGQSRTASCTISNIWSDMTVTGVFAYTATRYVPGDYDTLQAAVSAAQAGDTIVIGANVYTNDVTLDKSLTLIATNATLDGALTVAAGTTGTLAGCQGLVVTGGITVANGGLLVVNGGTNDVGTLTVLSGGTVQVVNATAFIANGTTYTGTFTFVYGWETAVIPQVPNVADPFERYALGARLDRQGYFGWTASAGTVVVQTNKVQSGRAVEVPAMETLSGSVAATPGSNAWIECHYLDTARMTYDQLATLEVDGSTTVSLFVMTNGYVAVYNRDLGGSDVGGWEVCTNDLAGAELRVADGAFARITVNRNLARGRAAVFVNGRLIKEDLRFVTASPVGSFRVELDAGLSVSTYFDTYSVWTNATGIVSGDTDGDALSDASEIDRYGNTQVAPVGAVFRIR